MHSTHLRQDSIHGLMMGVAIGDALGLAREGLSRRTALRMFGRPTLAFQLLPGCGIYSDDTQLMLMAAQALLSSRSDWRPFRRSFLNRLAMYPLSIPAGIGGATLSAAFKSWFRGVGVPTGSASAGNGGATRAIFLSLALHGTEHRVAKWVEDSTRLTHTDPLASEGCQILAKLAQAAGTSKVNPLDVTALLQQTITTCKSPVLHEKLSELVPALQHSLSPSAVARHFGWDGGVSGFIVPTTVMASYCFLRYPNNFERAVQSAIGLGGDTDSVAAIVGGLVGAHIGYKNLPENLVKQLRMGPHGADWISRIADRLGHWPHGAEDLHMAPTLPSEPLLQLIRNLLTLVLALVHVGLRVPFRLLRTSKPKRAVKVTPKLAVV